MKETIAKFNVPSNSSSRVYVVSQYDDGSWACSCPAWIFKKGQRVDCKHIYEIRNKQSCCLNTNKADESHDTTITISGVMDKLKEVEAK